MWADSPWLSGKLAVFLEESDGGDLHAEINEFDIWYDRTTGLVVSKVG